MWAILFKIGSFFSSQFVSNVMKAGLQFYHEKNNTERQEFQTATGADVETYKAHVAAVEDANHLRAVTNTWWGAKLIILLVGVPAALHWALIMLDTTFKFGCGHIGCLGIGALPKPYDGYEWLILNSFFIIAPAMPVASALSTFLVMKGKR